MDELKQPDVDERDKDSSGVSAGGIGSSCSGSSNVSPFPSPTASRKQPPHARLAPLRAARLVPRQQQRCAASAAQVEQARHECRRVRHLRRHRTGQPAAAAATRDHHTRQALSVGPRGMLPRGQRCRTLAQPPPPGWVALKGGRTGSMWHAIAQLLKHQDRERLRRRVFLLSQASSSPSQLRSVAQRMHLQATSKQGGADICDRCIHKLATAKRDN